MRVKKSFHFPACLSGRQVSSFQFLKPWLSLFCQPTQLAGKRLGGLPTANWQLFLCLVSCILCLSSCHDYTAKPKAYPRVTFPQHQYNLYDPVSCPFRFERPVYSTVVNDTVFFGRKNFEPCWMTVDIAPFNGTINLTYKQISDTLKLEKLLEDAHKLSYKHTSKADYINEIGIENEHGVSGILYDVGGDAASSVQFFLTDSTRHFIRGALYFNNEPNTDSMAPVINFVKEDLRHLLKTFEWK